MLDAVLVRTDAHEGAVIPDMHVADTHAEVQNSCRSCRLHDSCLAAGLGDEDCARVGGIVAGHVMRRQGEVVCRSGTPLRCLHVVRSGMFKSCASGCDGRTQVVGIHMRGDILGFDGIASGEYQNDTVALEDGEVCVVPFEPLLSLARKLPRLHHNLIRAMSRQVELSYGMMLLLGEMGADERVAAFLLAYSRRLVDFGYSGREFTIRLLREEIASYLGMKLETVSRVLSRFKAQGLLAAENKHIRLLDIQGLQRAAGESAEGRSERDVPFSALAMRQRAARPAFASLM